MSNWQKIRLGDVCDLVQGLAINAKSKHLISDKGLPLLRIKDLLENKEEIFINEKEVPIKYVASKDDSIMTRTGQVGFVFMNRVGVVHNNS